MLSMSSSKYVYFVTRSKLHSFENLRIEYAYSPIRSTSYFDVKNWAADFPGYFIFKAFLDEFDQPFLFTL